MENLVEIVDNKINQVRTTSLDISFNELLDMYLNEELVIAPDYQRLFRWSQEKSSRFIETLILELPLPPIFVIEVEEGKYELIDGLQRISSYIQFRGELSDKDNLILKDCDIVPDLNGLSYDDFPKTLQIKLKRNFIRVEVLRKESDTSLRYHMFKRLNSGGEILSEQEIRNCTIRILNPKINEFIIEMSGYQPFKNVTSKIKSEDIEKKKNEELVLRFFTLKNYLEHYDKYDSIDDYLTHYMELIASEDVIFDYNDERIHFKKTFDILDNILGENIFSTKLNGNRFGRNFVLYYFDGLVLGIQKYLEKIIQHNKYADLVSIIQDIKDNDEFYRARTGSKSNTKKRIQIVESKLEEFFNGLH
ncbi:DUF262 domain-containing protein [Arcobacter roscoffensis]|uniref:DUF262 domain-containing protein n=1 Tax=Arcobacter roscoffensis TaxID=2961520 RepID=A0ABY5DZJ4_9BACT|nr:DUF262 domain-containing protein [Arcobacter roscoffensis]UTJ05372.1 DUF262 domain-containing protein [Arcobacter roscoffensis]